MGTYGGSGLQVGTYGGRGQDWEKKLAHLKRDRQGIELFVIVAGSLVDFVAGRGGVVTSRGYTGSLVQ